MPNTRVLILVGAAALALPDMRLHAQPAGYDIACSIQSSSGSRACDEPPPEHSCDTAADYASQPSRDATNITFVNRGDQPVKLYWLNFKGNRVLYQSLAPGGRQVQPTYIGHNWLVTTSTEQCIGIFETAPPSNIGDGAVSIAPPEIPLYEQPPPPAENLIWTPGYWAWSEDVSDYYWVAGTWADPPIVGYLWTPGYWVAQRGVFAWRAGYWGPHMGFYGGINYGYGYFGRGFVGGSWRDGRMMYNSAVTNVGRFQSSNAAYHQPVVNNAALARVSYSGASGSNARPNAAELAAAGDYHIAPTASQLQQLHMAHSNPAMRASLNNGHPSIGAAARPGESMNASLPAAHPGGTLSFMHSTPPPHPVRGVDTAVQPRLSQAHVAEPQAHASEPQAHAQEDRQPHQSSSQTHPRTVPHAEGHPP